MWSSGKLINRELISSTYHNEILPLFVGKQTLTSCREGGGGEATALEDQSASARLRPAVLQGEAVIPLAVLIRASQLGNLTPQRRGTQHRHSKIA
jgi:hypothetical protein